MRAISLLNSILRLPKCRIQAFPNCQTTLSQKKLQSQVTCPWERYKSIKCYEAERKIHISREQNDLSGVLIMDLESTGLSTKSSRIVEVAIRDSSGGENSCFETLINPGQCIPNSNIHGIRTGMVNQPHVPRMENLVPILMQYIESRQVPEGYPLIVAHNGKRFDVPLLANEFARCEIEMPTNWRFLDSYLLSREHMKSLGLPRKNLSLKGLREYYEISLMGASHRAMSDVNVLAVILERMVSEMNLTVSDLLDRSFGASDVLIKSSC